MNKKKIISISINLFIFITMAIATTVTLTIGARSTILDGFTNPRWTHVVSFTILSNIFLGLVALVTAIRTILKREPSRASTTWYLTAASAGMLTFLTVLLFLAPMRALNGKNYFDLFLEPMFFLHFLNPVLAAINFIFLSGDIKINLKSRLIATLPIVIYAVPYTLCVIFLKIWPDFYGITFGGRYYLVPIVFVVFWLVIFGISSALAAFHDKKASKTA